MSKSHSALPLFLSAALLGAALVAPASAEAGSKMRSPAKIAEESTIDVATRESFLRDVVMVLASSPSPIAANTVDAIRSGAVVVETLDRLSVEDCKQLIGENPRQWSGVVSADECVVGEEGHAAVPAKILATVSGYQHENRIYIRASLKKGAVREAAATVVHETNHVVNATHENYQSAQQKLEEEYRAYYVALVFTDGKAPNAAYLGWLKGWIIEQYALIGVSPTDVSDRPTGNVDNAMEKSAGVTLGAL